MARPRRSGIVALLLLTNLVGCGKSSTGPRPHVPAPQDYYVAFPANLDLTRDAALSLKITGVPATDGTVTVPGQGYAVAFTTDAAGLATVTLPDTVMLNAWDSVMARGVIVHTDDDATVLAISDKPGSMHPAAPFPATALGLHYRVMSAGGGSAVRGSFLALVGTQDLTTVTIQPTANAGTHTATVPFQVTLDRGDAYQLEATDSLGDLTGTDVLADKPIAAFGGHILGQVPPLTGFAGLLWTALPPASAVTGATFLAFPFNHRTGYRLRVLGLQNGTNLSASGISGLATTLNAGQLSEARTTTAASITTSQPVLVAQLAEGNSADTVSGADPCFTLLPPVSGFQTTYLFAPPTNQVGTLRVNLVVPASATGTITVNGAPVSSGGFTPIGASGYSGQSVTLTAPVNTIASSGASFGAVVYGWDAPGGYNGFCFAPRAGY